MVRASYITRLMRTKEITLLYIKIEALDTFLGYLKYHLVWNSNRTQQVLVGCWQHINYTASETD